MIDRRFSIDAFEEQCHDASAVDALARALQVAIAREVLTDLRAIGEKVAARLRELGHAVREADYDVDPEGMALVTFVDMGESVPRLRFDLDLVVTTKFPAETDALVPEDEVSGLFSG